MDDPRKVIMAHVTPELVQAMEYLFPNRCPAPGTPMDSVWHEAGQASVTLFFKDALEEASQTILEST